MEARVCKTRAAKLVNAVSRAIGAASRRQPMEAMSDQAPARERHWSAPQHGGRCRSTAAGGLERRVRKVGTRRETVSSAG